MASYMEHKDLANESIGVSRSHEIADAVHAVLERIAAAERSSGRSEGCVTLLAATKTRDVGEIMAAIDAGVRMIGENRPQEVTAKMAGLVRQCGERGYALGAAEERGSMQGGSPKDAAGRKTIPFHLIGQLQSNKINKVLPVVDTIESVDSLELALKISSRAQARGMEIGVFLEVNESGEASKSGCEPSEAEGLANRIGALPGLALRGLMTVGAHVDDRAVVERGFRHLRETRDAIANSGEPGTAGCLELSMGMTHDMDLAIAQGSTIVRVGTALFGERAFI